MKYQAVFKRYELKYLLDGKQLAAIQAALLPYMEPDAYGRTTIRNVYFDTDDFRLIRHSLEKPLYKEKLRLRSYAQAQPGSPVFVELKKKYDGVVYKRRLLLPEQEAVDWISGRVPNGTPCQISREIDYFLVFYPHLHPTVFLSYERVAYKMKDGGDFRVTFDDTILARQTGLSLEQPVSGVPLLPEDKVLMEVKCSGGMPLWMAHALSENHIYKTSFSKYGTAYQKLIFKEAFFHAGESV